MFKTVSVFLVCGSHSGHTSTGKEYTEWSYTGHWMTIPVSGDPTSALRWVHDLSIHSSTDEEDPDVDHPQFTNESIRKE